MCKLGLCYLIYVELLKYSGCAFVEMLHSNASYIRAVCLVSSINCVFIFTGNMRRYTLQKSGSLSTSLTTHTPRNR